MNIRRATLGDLDLMAGAPAREFCEYASPGVPIYNERRVREFLAQLIEKHFVILAEEDGVVAGGLGALVHPHIWNPDLRCATECFWWVLPEYRRGRAAYMLIREYAAYIEREGIAKANICLLERSDVSDRSLERFGFKPREHTFIKEMAHA